MIKIFLVSITTLIPVSTPCPLDRNVNASGVYSRCAVAHFTNAEFKRKEIKLFDHVLTAEDVFNLCGYSENCKYEEITIEQLNDIVNNSALNEEREKK